MPSNPRPRVALCLALSLTIPLCACMTGPNNGDHLDGSPVGQTVFYSGFHDRPDVPIEVQILRSATLDPSVASNWETVGTTRSGTLPMYWNDPAPLYQWTLDARPVPSPANARRLPLGGIGRVRAIAHEPTGDRGLYVFDNDFVSCLSAHAASSWQVIGSECTSPYASGIVTMLSFGASPTDADRPALRYLTRKGVSSEGETGIYYASIGAPARLTDFQRRYGFGTSGGDEASATYYNDGDLGLGREMHCRRFTTSSGDGVACYVSNYGVNAAGNPVFGGEAESALNDAIAHSHSFATVAMIYQPPITAPNSVQFMVYDGRTGALASHAQLDSRAANTSIPNNCLSCHGNGSSYRPTSVGLTGIHFPEVLNARFLPFDAQYFKYSGNPGFTYEDQADALRRLNALIMRTSPTQTTAAFVTSLYGDVNSPNAPLIRDAVLPGWNDSKAHRKLYQEVVRPYCLTCHGSRDTPPLDFGTASSFYSFASAIGPDVCESHQMPHAERTLHNLWLSPARAHLVSALGLRTDCKP